MGKWSIIRLVAGMIDLLATAIIAALNAGEIIHLGSRWWMPVSIFAGILLISWVIVDLRNTVENRPNIRVMPQKSGNNFWLEVFNDGISAKFSAQLKLLDGDENLVNILPEYETTWEKTKLFNETETEIMTGHNDRLKIAGIENPGSAFGSMLIRLHYFNYKRIESDYVDSNVWAPDAEPKVQKPWLNIRVIISSIPQLKGNVFTRDYRLSLFEFKELYHAK